MGDPWRSVQLTRHRERPRPPAFVRELAKGFVELGGDRSNARDMGLLAGVAKVAGYDALVLAHRPNTAAIGAVGLRTAVRLLALAERFGLAVVTVVDVAGLHPDGPPHGPMWPAAGRAIERFLAVDVPTVALLVGEGVGAAALAFVVSDQLVALEHAYLAPSAPEAVSAIVWRDSEHAADAARMMHVSVDRLVQLGMCDAVVPEGEGAHLGPAAVIEMAGQAVATALQTAVALAAQERRQRRIARFRAAGSWSHE